MSIISVKGLRKSYGKFEAVKGVTFSVEEGEIFGILGPNGAGKTTTVECLEGLRSYSDGSVEVFGLDPASHGREIRRRAGLQLQESGLPDDLKVKEAMDLYASFYKTSVEWEPIVDRIGLGDKVESRFSKLSGGQKQRLYIALALVNDPEIVFFDELTTGLDPQSRRTMWDLVSDVRDRGKTVVLTTHFMDEAEILCDRLAILDNGEIICIGTPENLIRAQQLDDKIWFSSTLELSPTLFDGIPDVTGFGPDGRRYLVTGTGDYLVKEVIDRLADQNIPFRHLRTEHPGLEDVFLALTGERIRE
jgi:ABC-2 type transport system ATP-binding protein